MFRLCTFSRIVLALAIVATPSRSAVFSSVRGLVHDPDHRPIGGAHVTIRSATSSFLQKLTTDADGTFSALTIPLGEYDVTAVHQGFQPSTERVVVSSGASPVLHFQLSLGSKVQVVDVREKALAANGETATPTTVISRREIRETPGADLTNSMNMITDYVPGAYMTHDQLHMRGGHQVSWTLDGVPIPNTNIASNVGPQIDPKDIDYLEAQRGGYSSDYGDRTYGVFNVIPRTGFERNNEAELYTTFGSFNQTNDQINFGSHSQRLAYFASLNGNRSDYGLSTPGPDILHDRVWGLGGMASFIYNADPDNQLRLLTTLRGDDYQVPNNGDQQAAGMRDLERERDAVVSFSWAHTFSPGILFTASPFYHFNSAHYDGDPNDKPLSTTQRLDSHYAGAQVTLAAVTQRNNALGGLYSFGQHEEDFVRLIANDGSNDSFRQTNAQTGQLEAAFLEDQYRPFSWLTLIGGVRLTHFAGSLSENAADPRLGGSIRIPRLHWVLRGFWGRYYQAPPLTTVGNALAEFAAAQGAGFVPLRGERDEEHQFGLAIPLRGWSFDVNNYAQRARNFFDHDAIGNSNVFFPLTIAGARLRGWEVAVRSPRLWNRGEVYLAYSYAHAEGTGAVTGGLTDFSLGESGYFLLDHDQRHTFHTGFNWTLPYSVTAGGNLYYGSGFTDGSQDYAAHLPGHTTFDLSLGKSFKERFSLSVTALNLMNRRFLLDNSLSFGGTHYADPRQIYLQLRYRFSY